MGKDIRIHKNYGNDMISLSVFCPIMSIGVKIAIPASINPFTRFIMWARSNKYTLSHIAKTIELSEQVVYEECTYLEHIQFMDSDFNLTKTGIKFLEDNEIVEKFNNKNFRILINGYTGKIINNNFNIINSVDNSLNLPQKISLKIINQSDNYFLRNAVKDILLREFKKNDNDFLSTLEVRTDGSLEPIGYAEYMSTTTSNADSIQISFISEIIEYHFKIQNYLLNHYRNAISTLEKLNTLDKELLSDKAKNILVMAVHEQEYQKKFESVYYDFVNKEFCERRDIETISCDDNCLIIKTSNQEQDAIEKEIKETCPKQYSISLIHKRIYKKLYILQFSRIERV